MYDILSTVSPWVVILILAAVIALLLAMVCWCLHLSRRKEATVCAKLSGIRVLRQAYHARSGGQTTALIYIDISLHRMRNRHSAHQASEGYGFVRRHLLGRVAAHPGSLIAHVDGKNFLILCDVCSESVSDEMRLLSRSLDQYAASLGIVDLPEMAVGYYLVTGSTVPFDEAVYRVRQVCKQAAESGKGFCVYNYEELRRQEQRERLETQIDQAIQENRFYLEFQPFVDLTSRRVIGGEVLARMREEQGSTVMPGQFLQAVESVGSQWKFDCYVFEKCCAWLACQDQRATLRYISCNFSRVSISRPDFAQMVIRTADKYNLPHHLIGIEITEEERSQSDSAARKCLSQLHEAGFRIFLDDFGRGYTTFSDFQEYQIDLVKVDRDLLLQAHEKRGGILYDSLIRMAKELGCIVLCEGIETAEQLEWVRRSGADVVQGYYYYPPLPAEEFEKILGCAAIPGEFHVTSV